MTLSIFLILWTGFLFTLPYKQILTLEISLHYFNRRVKYGPMQICGGLTLTLDDWTVARSPMSF